MEVTGTLLDGRSSTPLPARLSVVDDGLIRITTDGSAREVMLRDISVSERVGSIPRRISLADGVVFECSDNEAIDALLLGLRRSRFAGEVARWERHWGIALGALVALALGTVLFVTSGLPWLAKVAAGLMPAEADALIGAQSLEILDRLAFEDSRLDPGRQATIRTRFRSMISTADDGHAYRLEFRSGRATGPNAFALPSGIIVLTDELVDLAGSEDEIVAVLAHEVGHVRARHALRMLLQSAGLSAIAVTVLGDVSQVSVLAGAVPGLVHASYSRDFEREADNHAREWLRANGLAEDNLDAMLCNLQAGTGTEPDVLGFLSTHPPTRERARCQ